MTRSFGAGLLVLLVFASCTTRVVVVGHDHLQPIFVDAGSTRTPTMDPTADAAMGLVSMPDAMPLPPVIAQPDAGAPSVTPSMPVICSTGRADCDGNPQNGCEVNLNEDPAHCGSCTTACPYPHCACVGGALAVVCPVGRTDCDGDRRNGCEVDTNTSMANCGSCGRQCHTNGHDAITAVCAGGHCIITCQIEPFQQGDCDDNPDNGCETNLWANDNCGKCGVRCSCYEGTCR